MCVSQRTQERKRESAKEREGGKYHGVSACVRGRESERERPE